MKYFNRICVTCWFFAQIVLILKFNYYNNCNMWVIIYNFIIALIFGFYAYTEYKENK